MLREKWFAVALGIVVASLTQTDASAADVFCLQLADSYPQFNGVTVRVTTSLWSFETPTCAPPFKAIANLSDLQTQIPKIVAAVPLPQDNCAIYGINPVVSLSNPRMTPTNLTNWWYQWPFGVIKWGHTDTTRALFETEGTVVVWECLKGPPNVTIVWENLCVRIFRHDFCSRAPVKVETSEGPPIKAKLATMPFYLQQPFTLRRVSDDSLEVVPGEKTLQFTGLFGDLIELVIGVFIGDLNVSLNKGTEAIVVQ